MAITIHLVRHAQGFHNLNATNHQIPDPYLTPLGRQQCAELGRQFPHHDKITHLVASPMRRTLLTCLLSFAPAVSSGTKIVALPLVQELSGLPCDIGSEPEVLHAEYGHVAEFDIVPKGWNDKSSPQSPWAPEIAKLEERAREARLWLRTLGREAKAQDPDIVVVTHGGFLHFLTQDWDGMDMAKGQFVSPSPLRTRRPQVRSRLCRGELRSG